DAHDDADARAWLEGKMREAVVEARRPRTSGPHALVRFPTTAWDAPRPASPLRLIGDLTLRRGDEEFAGVWTDTAVGASLPGVMIPRDDGARAADAIDAHTEGWELVFTPRPDRADRRVERGPVFAGPPIVVPVAVRSSGTPRLAP